MKTFKITFAILLMLATTWAQDNPADKAAALFGQVEKRLVNADSITFDFTTQSTGYIESGTQGNMIWKRDNRARLASNGLFISNGVDLQFQSDGNSMHGTNGAVAAQAPTPPGLNESMKVGFMRMGLLHNMAVMIFSGLPEKSDCDARDWVQVSNFKSDSQENTVSLTFDVTVDGKPAANAELLLDKYTLLPVKRTQTVHFDDGDMQVVETYSHFKVFE